MMDYCEKEILVRKQLPGYLGIGNTSIARKRREGDFPEPIFKDTERPYRNYWYKGDLDDWIENQDGQVDCRITALFTFNVRGKKVNYTLDQLIDLLKEKIDTGEYQPKDEVSSVVTFFKRLMGAA